MILDTAQVTTIREAVSHMAMVLSGEELSKSSLIKALEKAKKTLAILDSPPAEAKGARELDVASRCYTMFLENRPIPEAAALIIEALAASGSGEL